MAEIHVGEKHGSETQTAKLRRQTELKQAKGSRIAGVNVKLNEDKENAINAKGQCSRETSVVSGTMKIGVQNRHQKPLRLLNHQHEEVELHRGKKTFRGWSPPQKFVRQLWRDYLKGICDKSPCDYWHPPECQFWKSESGCKFGDKCSYAHRQVESQPSKKTEKGWWQNWSGYIEKCMTIGLRISGYRAAGILTDFTEEPKVLGPIRECSLQKGRRWCKLPRKRRSVARKNQVKSSHQRSPYAMKFEERCARGNAWKLAKNSYKLNETEKATFFSLTNEWCLPARHPWENRRKESSL